MMAEIRAVGPDEAGQFFAVLEVAAGRNPDPEPAGGRLVPAYMLAALEDGRIVGGTGAELIELTVPGLLPVPTAKITLTGLLPTHRRRGIASALMRRQLHDLAEHGTPLAALTAAESNVPGRHGYGVATRAMAVEVATRAEVGPVDPPVELVTPTGARDRLPPLFDRHRRAQVGQVSRPDAFWTGWFVDDPLLRTSPGPRFVAITDHGYLTYRLSYGPLRDRPVEALLIEDLVAVTEPARRALWSFCLGFCQAKMVAALNLPADEPVAWSLPDPRDLRVVSVRPFLRLRILSVAAALSARRYRRADDLVLDVRDPVLDGNNGRFLLRGAPDGASCDATTRSPDLSLSVADLATVYLGDTTLTTLARTGRVDAKEGHIARADAMFGTEIAPWTVTDW
jgi:predicted acetyltransferase